MIKVIYNGIDPIFPYPTPLIAVDNEHVYYGEKWAQKDALTLNGQITGCSFEAILSGYNQIKSRFAKCYQPFTVWQISGATSGKIYQADVVSLLNFNISPQRWIGALDYSIELECYPSGYFSGVYGILNPNEEWNLEESDDYRGNITHTISCLGLNTSNGNNNALENAKNWALAKRGTSSFITPAFIGNVNSSNLCLLQSAENINRFDGTYSLTDTYTTDLTRTGYGILRYSTVIESGNSLINVSLNGSVEGCGQNITGARQVFSSLDKYGAALLNYQRSFGGSDLNPIPLSYNIEEDSSETVINFSYQFDNDSSPETYFDYTVSAFSGDSVGVSIEGDIISRGGSIKEKLEKSLAFTGANLFGLSQSFYNSFYPQSTLAPLNNKPLVSGRVIDQVNGTIKLNAEFGNSKIINGLDSINYTISFSPALQKLDFKPRVTAQNGLYSVVNLNYATRASLNINGEAVVSDSTTSDNGLVAVRGFIQSKFSEYGRNMNAVLDKSQINYSRYDKKKINFDVSWSFDGKNIVNQAISSVSTLEI